MDKDVKQITFLDSFCIHASLWGDVFFFARLQVLCLFLYLCTIGVAQLHFDGCGWMWVGRCGWVFGWMAQLVDNADLRTPEN